MTMSTKRIIANKLSNSVDLNLSGIKEEEEEEEETFLERSTDRDRGNHFYVF